MIYLLGSVTLAVLGLVPNWLGLRCKTRWMAWAIIGCQPVYVSYDCYTHQYGFMISTAVAIGMAVHTLKAG